MRNLTSFLCDRCCWGCVPVRTGTSDTARCRRWRRLKAIAAGSVSRSRYLAARGVITNWAAACGCRAQSRTSKTDDDDSRSSSVDRRLFALVIVFVKT